MFFIHISPVVAQDQRIISPTNAPNKGSSFVNNVVAVTDFYLINRLHMERTLCEERLPIAQGNNSQNILNDKKLILSFNKSTVFQQTAL